MYTGSLSVDVISLLILHSHCTMSPSIYGSPVVPSNSTHTLQLSYPSEEWKLSLQEVKLLYLQRQYKQCAAKSTKLLRKADNQVSFSLNAFLDTRLEFRTEQLIFHSSMQSIKHSSITTVLSLMNHWEETLTITQATNSHSST